MPALRTLLAAIALVSFALLGCASDDMQTSTVLDPLTRFPDTGTYKWDNTRNKVPNDERIEALGLDPMIREAAQAAFAERGYTATTGAAPYYLHYELAVNSWYGPDDSKAVASLSLVLVDAKRGPPRLDRLWPGRNAREASAMRSGGSGCTRRQKKCSRISRRASGGARRRLAPRRIRDTPAPQCADRAGLLRDRFPGAL